MPRLQKLELRLVVKYLRRIFVSIGLSRNFHIDPLQPGVAFLYTLKGYKKGGIEKQHQAVMD